MNFITLTTVDLIISATLIVLLGALSFVLNLGMARSILISALRMTVQLLLVGWILKFLFANASFITVLAVSLFMLLAAGREVNLRQKHRLKGWWAFGIGTSSLFISSFFITLIGLTVIVSVDPWYQPQYAIPLLGMLLGNTMTGIALGVDQLINSIIAQKKIIEQRLMLGQTKQEATQEISREAIRSALIPIINAMAAAGIVSLPGMMTGQIIAGSPPVEAVKYQIMVMFLIAGSTGLGSILSVKITALKLFDERHRLRLDHLRQTTTANE